MYESSRNQHNTIQKSHNNRRQNISSKHSSGTNAFKYSDDIPYVQSDSTGNIKNIIVRSMSSNISVPHNKFKTKIINNASQVHRTIIKI